MTAWKTSKARQIVSALDGATETTAEIARRLDTTQAYVRAVASRECIPVPTPTHCKHCGTKIKDQKTGNRARSACDDCKTANASRRMKTWWQQKTKKQEARA